MGIVHLLHLNKLKLNYINFSILFSYVFNSASQVELFFYLRFLNISIENKLAHTDYK